MKSSRSWASAYTLYTHRFLHSRFLPLDVVVDKLIVRGVQNLETVSVSTDKR